MELKGPLKEGRFLKRYKRFFADIDLDGELLVAHVPNTGSLRTCLFPDAPSIVTMSTDPKRKLKATLHFVKTPSGWAGVDTSLPNLLVFEAWEKGLLPHWSKLKAAKREYKLSKETRLDLVLAPNEKDLEEGKHLHFIEVKNVTYVDGKTALFPDAVTTRGQKHLQELMELRKKGFGAEIVFVVQRQGCENFGPADEIDPVYGTLLRQAQAAGVKITALPCHFQIPSGIELSSKPLKLLLDK